MTTPLSNKPRFVPDRRIPLVIAHRGASGLAPENTLDAFRLAVALGADGVELDVQLSADGYPVVIHDARVNRTTDGTGAVSRLSLNELRTLDAGGWFDRRLMRKPRVRATARQVWAESGKPSKNFSQERVPSLDAVLTLLAGAGLDRIYVELKGTHTNRQALLEATLSTIRSRRVGNLVTLLSFDHRMIADAKRFAPDIRTAATFPAKGNRLISTRSIIRSAQAAGVDEVALHFGLITRRAVESLHEQGLSVSAWTANGKLSMRRLVLCQVDAIMTNFPNRLRSILDSKSHRSNERRLRGGRSNL